MVDKDMSTKEGVDSMTYEDALNHLKEWPKVDPRGAVELIEQLWKGSNRVKHSYGSQFVRYEQITFTTGKYEENKELVRAFSYSEAFDLCWVMSKVGSIPGNQVHSFNLKLG